MNIAPTNGHEPIFPALSGQAAQAVFLSSTRFIDFPFGPARRFCRLASYAIWARSSEDSSVSRNRTSVLPKARMHRRKNANENVPRAILLLIDLAGSTGPNAAIKWDNRLFVTRWAASSARKTDAASRCQCVIPAFFTGAMRRSVAKRLFLRALVLILQDIALCLRTMP
jgi:hypothetical protein